MNTVVHSEEQFGTVTNIISIPYCLDHYKFDALVNKILIAIILPQAKLPLQWKMAYKISLLGNYSTNG
jgi:hypothetical protein